MPKYGISSIYRKIQIALLTENFCLKSLEIKIFQVRYGNSFSQEFTPGNGVPPLRNLAPIIITTQTQPHPMHSSNSSFKFISDAV